MPRRNETIKFGPGNGDKLVQDHDDFLGVCWSATDNTLPWLATLDNGSAAIADDGPDGLLVLTTHTDDNDVVNFQKVGEAHKLVAGKRKVVTVQNIKVNDADQTAFFIGLAVADVEILNDTGSGEGAVADAIGFMWDGSKLYAVASKNGTATWVTKIDTGVTLSDNTFVKEMVFTFNGAGIVRWYVEGALVASVDQSAITTKTAYPDDECMTKTIEVQNHDASANTLTVDRFDVDGDRYSILNA